MVETPEESVPPFPKARLTYVDWSGIDITQESQREERRTTSIQFRVIQQLRRRGGYEVIFDDDDRGEAADVIAIRIDTTGGREVIVAELYHCKFAKGVAPGARIEDLYVVCGQAQRSASWLSSRNRTTELFTHLLKREASRRSRGGSSRFEVGHENDLVRLRALSRKASVRLEVVVVQPGLSREQASDSQLRLLAVTEGFLTETYGIPFGVWCGA